MTMLETVQKDKRKIEETIQSLDTYKLEALEKTWSKVNKYVVFLSKCFAILLSNICIGTLRRYLPTYYLATHVAFRHRKARLYRKV